MSAVSTIALAVIVSVVAPTILAVLTGRQNERKTASEAEQRRADKQADWDREDAVAEKAAAAAKQLIEQQATAAAKAEEAASLLLAANERVASTAAITNTKLDVIHTLVNSSMTAAMQSELDARVNELVLMREVIELRRAAGTEPLPEALAAIDVMTEKIGELRAKIDDRLKQTEVAVGQEAAATAKANAEAAESQREAATVQKEAAVLQKEAADAVSSAFAPLEGPPEPPVGG